MSKNDVSTSSSSPIASKAAALSSRQSFLRRLTPPSPASSISAPFLKSSKSSSPSKTTGKKLGSDARQMPLKDDKRRGQQPRLNPVSRLESVRLALMASVSRRRSHSTSDIPSKKQQQEQQKKNRLPLSNSSHFSTKKANGNSNKKDVRDSRCTSGSGNGGSRIGANSNIGGHRLSLYAPPLAPRHFLLRRRPLSQFGGLGRIVEDDASAWNQGTSTSTTVSSDQCSTRSNSTRSSSSSSIRTVSENNSSNKNGSATIFTTTNSSCIHSSKLLLKGPQKVITANDQNKQQQPWGLSACTPAPNPPAPPPPPSSPLQPPTPVTSLSTSLYPARLRGIIKSPTALDAMPAVQLEMKPMNGTAMHTPSILLTTPANVQKKEDRAISLWRNTVSQLMSETSPTTVGYSHGESPESGFRAIDSKKDNMALCKFIMNELFTTEQSYQALLTLIQTRYMQPMMAAVNDPLVKQSDIGVLFRHLPEMIDLSNKLLLSLESHACSLWRDFCPGQIAEIFDMVQDDLAVFLRYAVHYQANLKSIRRACNNVLFIKIEQESLARRDTNRMGIADYLIAPFQRVPRYCLLVKDLIKHSDRTDLVQHARLHATLKLLTGLTMTMDHVQKISR
ncbi:Dbl homology domain-containing protein [Dichotomocladium elegans]|nr:Dbl homology domain-containing protein [Dichotomocladium elegans]